MEGLKTIELKFILKLLGCDGYRGKMKALSPNSGTKATDRDRICEALGVRDLVEYDSQIERFSLQTPGKTLLSLDTTSLPVTPDELKVLKACQKKKSEKSKGYTTPGDVSGVPASARQDLIRSLTERGMLKITKEAIKEVWLTAQGKQFLLHEYEPTGSYASAASATMLGNYVRFLRENLDQSNSFPTSQPRMQSADTMPIGAQTKPDAQAVLQQIKQLDRLIGSDNYLPIYHLREKLQPPLTREELDEHLYELQRSDRVELSSLHGQGNYSETQVGAGIPQENRCYLFFISVL